VSVDGVVAELNAIVRPDGAELRVKERSETSLLLELDLTNSDCPECVVPKDLLLDILRKNLAMADPDVRDVDLHDPRELS
jgi:hypothetical protein